ncbi:MAG: hypothetical protein LW688_02495 [Cryomorphaceae bacterium]|nr:hypothetical protein [Cryomorphaceae bacterium]
MWIKRLYANKWFKIPYLVLLYSFAIYGFFLASVYVAMRFRLTQEAGQIDENNRYFQRMSDKYNLSFRVDSTYYTKKRFEVLDRILLLNEFYPKNASYILDVYKQTSDERLALKMLDAVDLRLSSNSEYMSKTRKLEQQKTKNKQKITALSAFDWMNVAEWKYFREALKKDKPYIDSAAKAAGVEARTIVAALVGEQVRLFNSRRERFKEYIAPLKSLSVGTMMSFGPTGIKENTAMRIERNLKDSSSVYYLGKAYEHLLDFDSSEVFSHAVHDTMSLRIKRLAQYKDHYYSFLYTALFIKQIKMQWERAGFPIEERPEIFASLFNLGYHKSKPKKYPSVGGSVFKVHDKEYTFGGVAFDFYYSGELADIFPYQADKFPEAVISPKKIKKMVADTLN